MSDDESVETVLACPLCDTAGHFNRRMGQRPDRMAGNIEDEFYCKSCQQSFDAPIERPRKRQPRNGGGSTLAHKLSRMDPDELPRRT